MTRPGDYVVSTRVKLGVSGEVVVRNGAEVTVWEPGCILIDAGGARTIIEMRRRDLPVLPCPPSHLEHRFKLRNGNSHTRLPRP